jgi:hypothetical protein
MLPDATRRELSTNLATKSLDIRKKDSTSFLSLPHELRQIILLKACGFHTLHLPPPIVLPEGDDLLSYWMRFQKPRQQLVWTDRIVRRSSYAKGCWKVLRHVDGRLNDDMSEVQRLWQRRILLFWDEIDSV